MDGDYYMGPERRDVATRPADFSAIAIGAFVIIGITMLLLAFGGALGVEVPTGSAEGAMATDFATWAVVSAVFGTLLGCMVGGLLCVRHTLSSAIGHGVATCAAAVAFGALLGVLGVPGLLGSAMTLTATVIGPASVASIGWGGWALFVGLLVSFVVAVLGWMAGLALRPRARTELRIEERHIVRPSREVRNGGDVRVRTRS
jgi:hypothetical protein